MSYREGQHSEDLFHALSDPGEIDLHRHGLIEASAGTGKTYSIEHLFLRLLEERNLRVDQILVVTFTEKATGELKERIRRKMEGRWEEARKKVAGEPTKDSKKKGKPQETLPLFAETSRPGASVEILESALNAFDTASIHTIHGFCNHVIRQYGFEMGREFQSKLADDADLAPTLLKGILRDVWPQRYGGSLESLLRLSGYPGTDTLDGSSRWEKTIIDVLLSCQGRCRETLRPEIGEDPLEPLHQLQRTGDSIRASFQEICELMEFDPGQPLKENSFYRAYEGLKIHGTTKKYILEKMIEPLLSALARLAAEGETDPGEILSDYLAICESYSGFHKMDAKAHPTGKFRILAEKAEEKCDPDLLSRIERLAVHLHGMEGSGYNRIGGLLKARAVLDMEEALSRHKEERALLSYGDMLLLMDAALPEGGTNDFLLALRAKYSVAIVDEFQDTDPVQWSLFRKLFLLSGSHTLFLVGDPKQSIYGFRGADVQAYLAAREALAKMAAMEPPSARLYRLGTVYRSDPALLEAFNDIFASRHWFGAPGAGGESGEEAGQGKDGDAEKENRSIMESITYFPVKAGEREKRKLRVYQDRSERAPLTLVDLNRSSSSVRVFPAKQSYFSFIAREIQTLVGEERIRIGEESKDDLQEDTDKNKKKNEREQEGKIYPPRPLRYSDICILVEKKSDVPLIEPHLRERGIPHSFYKKPGIYRSTEALEIILLLSAILKPGDSGRLTRALLTSFFSIKPEDLENYRELSPDHPIKENFLEWNRYARLRQWPSLFTSLLTKTAANLPRPTADDPGGTRDFDFDRRITNLEHIFQELETAARRDNLDAEGVLERLHSLRQGETEISDEEDLHRQETEEPRVRIMTIHASKGLEYPVVFVAGGFSAGHVSHMNYFVYHDGKSATPARRIYDLLKTEPEAQSREREAEWKRLYYVAFTRAMLKIYFPLYGERSAHSGALQGFIKDSIQDTRGNLEAKGYALFLKPDSNRTDQPEKQSRSDKPVPPVPSNQIVSLEQYGSEPKSATRAKSSEIVKLSTLFPEPPEHPERRTLRLLSYTSLHRSLERSEETSYGDGGAVEHDEIPEWSNPLEEEGEAGGDKTPDPIGAGADTGTLLHEILEQVDFRSFAPGAVFAADGAPLFRDLPGEVQSIIDRGLAKSPLRSRFQENAQSLEAVQNRITEILHHTLCAPLPSVEPFRLCDLEAKDRLSEMDFFYRLPDPSEDYLFGFVDLIFRHNNRYYVADWKSNLLEDYDAPSISEAMEIHDYHLQYRIYSAAVARWLSSLLPGFQYERDFGGVFYFFLRGMRSAEPGRGVFHRKPSAEELMEVADRIGWSGRGGKSEKNGANEISGKLDGEGGDHGPN